MRHNETNCTGADANKREPTRMVPTKTLKQGNKQKPA